MRTTAAGPGSSSPFPFPPEADGASVLVVEDDPVQRRILTASLAAFGYTVTSVTTGAEAMRVAAAGLPDVTILDLGLPDVDGIDVCRQLRHGSTNPIIVLTADGTEDRMIAALDQGADDYITKPYSMPEVLARIRVGLRHRSLIVGASPSVVEVGDLRVDLEAHEVELGGRPLHLTRREYVALVALARNAGRVVTRTALAAEIWGSGNEGDEQHTLNVVIGLLRKKLAAATGKVEVMTEPGIGYRLVSS